MSIFRLRPNCRSVLEEKPYKVIYQLFDGPSLSNRRLKNFHNGTYLIFYNFWSVFSSRVSVFSLLKSIKQYCLNRNPMKVFHALMFSSMTQISTGLPN